MKIPENEECRCWNDYPNKNWHYGYYCQFYECVREATATRKTICKRKRVEDGQGRAYPMQGR